MQYNRQREMDDSVDSFFDKNKLYLKTALDHKLNQSPPRSRDASNLIYETMQSAPSIDHTTVDNQVVNKQEYA